MPKCYVCGVIKDDHQMVATNDPFCQSCVKKYVYSHRIHIPAKVFETNHHLLDGRHALYM